MFLNARGVDSVSHVDTLPDIRKCEKFDDDDNYDITFFLNA